MKHEELYDKHSENRKKVQKPKKRRLGEGTDNDARRQRVSFKNYVRELEENFLEDDLEDDSL